MTGEIHVCSKPSEINNNIQINKRSIVLLFKGSDAVIARNWRKLDKSENIVDTRHSV